MNPRTAFADALLARQIARRYLKKMGMEHDSPEALKDYLKEHPGADKSKHTVKKDESEEKGKDEGGGKAISIGGKSFKPSQLADLRHEVYDAAKKTLGEDHKFGQNPSVDKAWYAFSNLLDDVKDAGKQGDIDPKQAEQLAKKLDKAHGKLEAEVKKSKGNKPGKAHKDLSSLLERAKKEHAGNPDVQKAIKAVERLQKSEEAKGQFDEETAAVLHENLNNVVKKHDKGGEGKSEAKPGKKRSKAVRNVMERRNLKDEDADELEDFVKRKPAKGQKLSDFQLMQKFLREASPETKKRMKEMSISEFKAMYNSIMDEEGEGTAKAAALSVLARFVAAADYKEYVERKKQEGGKPLSRDEWEARTQGGKDEGSKKDESKEKDEEDEGKKGPDLPVEWERKSMTWGEMPSEKDFEKHIREGEDDDGEPLWDDKKGYSVKLVGRDRDVAEILDLDWDTKLKDPKEAYKYIKELKDFSEHDDDWYVEQGIKAKEVESYRDSAMNLASTMMDTLGYEWI